MIVPVREGVFFTTPPALPKGRHGLSHREVLTRQRERLMIAATELMAADGYRSLGVRDVSTRAHVSQPSFYECFTDKDACIFAAYDRFLTVLAERMLSSVDTPATTPWDEVVSRVVLAFAGTLEADPVVGRAFMLELEGLGRPARERRRSAIHAIALLLKTERDRYWPGAAGVPLSAYAAGVYAMRQLTADQLDEPGADPPVRGVATELVPTIATMLRPEVVG
ncbi:TetR/AcrR family transcriptional regulator [Aeromicrobium massiliense]|uniref:TetR/AcrR family transcriptional regulator n=1 Tax=Aeromicrobium massiliense TaxID=1464554 RepID=UPI00031FA777|nr:TetR/AcrR family transcriptional regulator [Aeromicrobium massiliense]